MHSEIDRLKARKDAAYDERMHLVAALARLFPSGMRDTNTLDWTPAWKGCVYIDLPTGKISYHYHTRHTTLFAGLPPEPHALADLYAVLDDRERPYYEHREAA